MDVMVTVTARLAPVLFGMVHVAHESVWTTAEAQARPLPMLTATLDPNGPKFVPTTVAVGPANAPAEDGMIERI